MQVTPGYVLTYFATASVRRLHVVYSESNHIIMIVLENVPLGPLTTLKVGGPARYFAEPKTINEAGEGVQFASSRSLPLFLLRGGSNLVISDARWPGLVTTIAIAGSEEHNERGTTLTECG